MKTMYALGILCLLALVACGTQEQTDTQRELLAVNSSTTNEIVIVNPDQITVFCGNVATHMQDLPRNFTTVEQTFADVTARMGFALCEDPKTANVMLVD